MVENQNDWPEYELTVQTEDVCKTPPRSEPTSYGTFPYSPISPASPRIKIIDNIVVQKASPEPDNIAYVKMMPNQESEATYESQKQIDDTSIAPQFSSVYATTGLSDQNNEHLEEFMETIHFGSGSEQSESAGTKIIHFPSIQAPAVTDTSKLSQYLDQLGNNQFDHVYEKPLNEDKAEHFPEFRLNGVQRIEEDSDGTHLEDELDDSANEELANFDIATVEINFPKQRCADKHLKIEAYQAKTQENKHSEEEDENMDEFDDDISLSSTPISDQNLDRVSPKTIVTEDNNLNKDLSSDAGPSIKDSEEKELDENGVDVKIWKDNYLRNNPPDQETMDNNEKVKILTDIANEEEQEELEEEIIYDNDKMYYENPDDITVEFEESYVAGLDKNASFQDSDGTNLQEEVASNSFEIPLSLQSAIESAQPSSSTTTYTKKKVREKAIPLKKSPKKKEKLSRTEPKRSPKPPTNKRKTKPPQQLLPNNKALAVLTQQRYLAEQERVAAMAFQNTKIFKEQQEELERVSLKSCLKKKGAPKPNKIVMFPSDLPESNQRLQLKLKSRSSI